jgi:hypothetical protein
VILKYDTSALIRVPAEAAVPNLRKVVAVVVAVTICLYISFILATVNEFVAPWSLPLSDILSVTVTVSVAAVSVVAIYFLLSSLFE